MQPHILQLGAFKQDASTLAKAAQSAGLKLLVADSIEQAIQILSDKRMEMIFADHDIGLPTLFSAMNDNKLSTPIVAVGPAQPVQNAVKAIRLGAIEYLSTPMDTTLIDALLEKLKPQPEGSGPIAGDPKTLDIISQSKQFASSNATVLLRGESGTGKEVFSRLVHDNSPRKDKDFISVNCAAIPENLLESELFGHEKGSFSGAINKRLGKFQQADGGTLLLDEISEMDLGLQSKLLRAIQERVVDPVGSSQPVSVDIRLIATTNRNLEDYVAEGSFREDLYFRLNVVAIDIPPLRDRGGDIIPLAAYFAKTYGEQNGLSKVTFSPEAEEKLNTCYWKGNVRELENTIHRAILMMGDNTTMLPEHIVISPISLRMMEENGAPAEETVAAANVNAAAAQRYAAASGNFEEGTGGNSPLVGKSIQEMEKDLIISTMSYCQGNRTHAADILGISIRTLRTKLKEYEESMPETAKSPSAQVGA